MPIVKFTVSDRELTAYKASAENSMLPLNEWARFSLTALAKDAAPHPSKPASKWSKGDVTKFQKTLADCAEHKFDLAEYVALFASTDHGTASGKEYVARFAEWARENGHLGE